MTSIPILAPNDLLPRQVKKDSLGHLLSSEVAWLRRLFAANVPTAKLVELSGTTENTICRQRREWEAAERAAGREPPRRTPSHNRWPDAEKRRAAILKLIKARVSAKQIVKLLGTNHQLVAKVRRQMKKPIYAPSSRRADPAVVKRVKQLIVNKHPRTVIERAAGVGAKLIGKCGKELATLAEKTGQPAPTCRCGRRALHNGTCFVTDALKRRHLDFSSQIERAVPRWLDPATRDDAKSQLAEDILVGLVLDTEIRAVGPHYAKAAANRWSSKFGPRSIDAPLTEDGLTLADVMPDPDSLISMEERIDAKREAKIQAIIAPLLKPANVLPAAEPPAPTTPASALPLNDLMSDLRHAVDKGSSLTLRYEQVAALLSGKFVEWLAPLVNAELVALSNERMARA